MLGAAHCTIALDSGPEITSVQAFAEAEQRFSNALQHAQSSGSGDIANAALVGRARVKLYQGDGQGAVADARQVPEGFRMDIYPSDAPNRLNNRIWATNLFNFSFGVAPWTRELMTGGVLESAHHHLRHRPEHRLGAGQRVGPEQVHVGEFTHADRPLGGGTVDHRRSGGR